MNNFILELPELKNYYSQAELIKIWEDNQHVPFSDSPEIQHDPNYCVESRIIKIDITKKLNHNIMTKEPEVWLVHKFAEHKLVQHTDDYLQLVIPIDPQTYEVQFLNNVKDTDIIYGHNYRMPTLINGHLPHTANDKYMKRLYIGITLFFKQKSNSLWHDIDKYYNNGELIHGL